MEDCAMTFEERFFARRRADFNALRDYGFSETDGGFCLRQSVAGGQFVLEVFVSAEGIVSSRMLDKDSGSEYTLYKVAGASGTFVGAAREEAECVLSAVAERCFVPDVFRSGQARAVIDHAVARYGSRPEFLWKNLSENAVLRRADSRKWFAVFAIVSREKLGLAGRGRVEIIDLRIFPDALPSTLDGQHFLPGWHMNKRTWYTVVLDGGVCTDDLIRRLDESWRLAEK